MIIIHEAGHFFMAKMFKVDIETFSFGFGPPIFKRTSKRTGTTFQISSWIFGGYCRMKGQDDVKRAIKEKDHYIRNVEEGSLYSIRPFKRMLIYFFGPITNFIFAFICLLILFLIHSIILTNPPKIVLAQDYPAIFANAPNQSNSGLKTGMEIESIDGIEVNTFQDIENLLTQRKLTKAEIITTISNKVYTVVPVNGVYGISSFVEPLVNFVAPFSPEKKAGLRKYDIIQSINGRKVTNMFDILNITLENPTFITLKVVDNKGNIKKVNFKPLIENGKIVINFNLQSDKAYLLGENFSNAFSSSLKETTNIFIKIFHAFFNIVNKKSDAKGNVTGSFVASQTVGYLTAKGFAENLNTGIRTVLYLLAGISISLAFVNILPIPALDGGYIIMGIIESILGRTLHPMTYIIVQVFGFVLIGIIFCILHFG